MKRKILTCFICLLIIYLSIFTVNFSNESAFKENKTSEPTTKVTTTVQTTKVTQTNITFTFLGDCMMASYKGQFSNGNMNWSLENRPYSYFFEKAQPFIGKDDFTITNCENVFTDTHTSEIAKDHSPAYWYRSASKNAQVFFANSIEAVSISNNHINDYGTGGAEDTKAALEKANVLWGNTDNPLILEKDGISFGILCVGFWGSYNTNSIVQKILDISNSTDIQIVYFHGGTMKIHQPEQWKKDGVYKFIDAGADLVIGSHPHVLQRYEQYEGVDIVYSLGNFCYGGSKHPENRTVLFQETFTFSGNSLISTNHNIIPFFVYGSESNNWQPKPIEDETIKKQVLDFMYGNSDSLF